MMLITAVIQKIYLSLIDKVNTDRQKFLKMHVKIFKKFSCGCFLKNFMITINLVIKSTEVIRCRLRSTSSCIYV